MSIIEFEFIRASFTYSTDESLSLHEIMLHVLQTNVLYRLFLSPWRYLCINFLKVLMVALNSTDGNLALRF